MHNLFIEDTNLTKAIELGRDNYNGNLRDSTHPFWKLLWNVLSNRGLRYNYFIVGL